MPPHETQENNLPPSQNGSVIRFEEEEDEDVEENSPKQNPGGLPFSDSDPLLLTNRERGIFTFTKGALSFVVKNLKLHVQIDLKVYLKIFFQGEQIFFQYVNLLGPKDQGRLVNLLRETLGISESTIRQVILDLTNALETMQEEADKRRHEELQAPFVVNYDISEEDERRAVQSLRERDYLTETMPEDMEYMGIVGELTNKILLFAAGISRLDEKPLHVLFLSNSGTGKSKLQSCVLDFFPPNAYRRISRSTANALWHLGRDDLSGKILSPDEVGGMIEGDYSYRTMMSEGKLELLVTGKDEVGNHRTMLKSIKGNCSVFLATTDINSLDRETRGRMIVLSGDESEEQTRLIRKSQLFFDTAEGQKRKMEFPAILKKHQDMIHMIKGVNVVFPKNRVFEKASEWNNYLSERRNYLGFLTLVKAVARSRMYRRKIFRLNGADTINVEMEDVKLVKELTRDIFTSGREVLQGPVKNIYDKFRRFVEKHKGVLKPSEYGVEMKTFIPSSGLGTSHVYECVGKLLKLEYLFVKRPLSRNRPSRYFLMEEG